MKIFRSFLNLLTIQASYNAVRFYHRSNWNDSLLAALIRLILPWMCLVALRLQLCVYYSFTGQYSILERFEPFFYAWSTTESRVDTLLYLSFYLLALQSVNVVHYTVSKIEKVYFMFFEEVDQWFELMERKGYTFLDCLFNSSKEPDRKCSFLADFRSSVNPFFNRADGLKMDRFLKVLEGLYFVCALFVGSVIVLTVPFSGLFFSKRLNCPLVSLRMGAFLIDLFMVLVVAVIVGISSTILMLFEAVLDLKLITLPYSRFVTSFQKAGTDKRLIRRLLRGKAMFVFSMFYYRLFALNGIDEVFAFSIMAANCSGVIMTLQMILNDLQFGLKMINLMIVILATIAVVYPTIYLTESTRILYSLGKPFRRGLVTSGMSLSNSIQLSFFLEVLTARRKFCFTIGSLGKITRMTLVKAIPMYTSLIMFILPLVQRR